MSDAISGKARVAGVMGWPVAHSRSPRLHNWWIRRHGLDAAYIPMPVPPDRLAEALRALPALGMRGCNLTLPHKEAALAVLDEVDPAARRIGAVNTVVVQADGRLRGSNTDAFGFLANLRVGAPDWHGSAGPAVVLGAGGGARAVVAALLEADVPEVRLVNRSLERAERLALDLGGPVRVLGWDAREDALGGAALLVNTTQLGMDGQPPLDLRLDGLPPGAVVTDIVYTPLETALLAAARARGNAVVDGLGMLLHQARPGFEAWFGVAPEVTPALRDFVLASL
ncbi:MAG TPA: shikimate dehydrogenase [Azospirillaceae bacterium]|nr:shikimate dehydrogenase [Azospirillaceae bacterium]